MTSLPFPRLSVHTEMLLVPAFKHRQSLWLYILYNHCYHVIQITWWYLNKFHLLRRPWASSAASLVIVATFVYAHGNRMRYMLTVIGGHRMIHFHLTKRDLLNWSCLCQLKTLTLIYCRSPYCRSLLHYTTTQEKNWTRFIYRCTEEAWAVKEIQNEDGTWSTASLCWMCIWSIQDEHRREKHRHQDIFIQSIKLKNVSASVMNALTYKCCRITTTIMSTKNPLPQAMSQPLSSPVNHVHLPV